ncbi:MAG: hypothetical protein CR966_00390 [Pseudomonadales bacterium]|nr:MAG: hypothetical protein CR966_00390 [Pseudomonadales bacterium]
MRYSDFQTYNTGLVNSHDPIHRVSKFSIYLAISLNILLALLSLFISLPSHAKVVDDSEVEYQESNLHYQRLDRQYLTGIDLMTLEVFGDDNSKHSININRQDYDPNNGMLMTTVDVYYNSDRLSKPTILQPMIEIDCLDISSSRCHNQYEETTSDNLPRPSANSDRANPEIDKYEKSRWMKSTAKNMKKQKWSNSFYFQTDEPTAVSIQLIASIPQGQRDNYGFLITTYAVETETSLLYKFLNSQQHINLVKGLAVLLMLLTIGYMLYQQREFAYRKTLIIGILLTLWGGLLLFVWDINYIIIGSGFVMIAGVFLIFGDGIGKILYLIGICLIAVISAMKFGITRDFFMQNTLPMLIAFAVLSLEENDYDDEEDFLPISKLNIDDKELAQQKQQFVKYAKRADDPDSLDIETTTIYIRVAGLVIILLIVISLAWSIMF